MFLKIHVIIIASLIQFSQLDKLDFLCKFDLTRPTLNWEIDRLDNFLIPIACTA